MRARRIFDFTLNLLALAGFVWLLCQAPLMTYLLRLGKGQLHILMSTRPVEEVLAEGQLPEAQKQKLKLVQEIKRYSVDSLGYKPTRNFTTYFDQQDQSLLWVVTACKPLAFEPYTWNFPLVGTVSYKGFFSKSLALREFISLRRQGYDAEVSPVAAWSTLGWLPDPVLSSMLNRSKGKLAALLFHELFHATYYAPGTVDVNENLANFFAYKATLKYLASDTAELRNFRLGMRDDSLYNAFIFQAYGELDSLYHSTRGLDSSTRVSLKEEMLARVYRRATRLPLAKPARFTYSNRSILGSGNAFFIDAQRYDGLYDSLNAVLATRFGGDLRAMIQSLKN